MGSESPTRPMHDVFLPAIFNESSNSSAGHSSLPSEIAVSEESHASFDGALGFVSPRPYHCKRVSLECPYCSISFQRHFLFNLHLRTHTGHKPYQCMICGRSFAQKPHVTKHMLTHKVWKHKAQQTKNNSVGNGCVKATMKRNLVIVECVCPYCGNNYEKPAQLQRHLIENHLKEKVFECPSLACRSVFDELVGLIDHLPVHKGELLYCCPYCNVRFDTLQHVAQHQVTHDLETTKNCASMGDKKKPFSCMTCGECFMSAQGLRRHENAESHEYTCPKCNKTYSNGRTLRKHAKVHNEDTNKFTCAQCKKTFLYAASLQKHMMVHSNVRMNCTRCSASFARQDALDRHVSAIHASPSIKCPFTPCQAYFSRRDHLKLHVSTHTPKPKVKPKTKKVKKVS